MIVVPDTIAFGANIQNAVRQQYAKAFDAECKREYPVIDAFEQRMGYAIDRKKLEDAARVLACPLKKNPPNWQHGRVLYAAVRHYLSTAGVTEALALDIGSAKGFSALCLWWAILDDRVTGYVASVDVIEPTSRAQRNTVAEVDGLKTLAEILSPWDVSGVLFTHGTGIDWLMANGGRVNVAFVDGKHNEDVVKQEAVLLANAQEPGDLVIFDDAHIPGVAKAIAHAGQYYALEYLAPHRDRIYAIGVRRG